MLKNVSRINFNKETYVPMTNRVITNRVEQIAFYKSLFNHKFVENTQSGMKGSAGLREHEIKESL